MQPKMRQAQLTGLETYKTGRYLKLCHQKFLKEVEITKWKKERLLNEYNFTLEYYTKENFKIRALTLRFWSTSRIVGLKS